ncbi:HesB/YadR/YfhF family protein [Lentibacillus saliphilus]|uniref:HesB/YadR/YfhF family protein n=1 Tax=Lentibacillus saliphilus TaxID=2737028 RepID=UPI001C2F2044|nr:hypothetical protein [Lentibacillus saliphilus]
MNITLTPSAANWYREDFDATETTAIRFFPRYGFGGRIPGFSLGVKQATPVDVFTSTEVDGMLFFIEESDAWYFEGVELHVSFDEHVQAPQFNYY